MMKKDFFKKRYRFKKGANSDQVTTYDNPNVLMKGNQLLSSKPFITIVCIVSFLTIFFTANYLIGCIVNLSVHFKDLISGAVSSSILFSLKNAFLINRHMSPAVYAVIVVFSAGCTVVFATKIRIAYKDLNVGQKGDDKFTSEKDIKKEYLAIAEKDEPFDGYGGLPVYRIDETLYIDQTMTNTHVIGTTRSGKGEAFIRLMIEIISRGRQQASMIINDPKLEQYPAAKESLEKRGYVTYLINCLDPLQGTHWNCLTEITKAYKNGDYDEAELICSALACSIYDSKPAAQTSDSGEFFVNTNRDCFSAMVLAVVIDCLEADKKENAKRFLVFLRKKDAFLKLNEEQQERFIEEMKEKRKQTKNFDWLKQKYIPADVRFKPTTKNEKKVNMFSLYHLFSTLAKIIPDRKRTPDLTALDFFFLKRPEFDRAKVKYTSVEISGGRTKANIFSSYITKLSVFTLHSNARMTAVSDFDIEDLGFGDKPVAVFLGLPDYDSSNHFIATAFIRQVYYVLSKKASQTRGGSCKRRVHEIIDEAGNTPKIDMLKSQMSMGLSRGIITHLFVQDDFQLPIIYGDEARSIKNNCGNQIFLSSVDVDTAKNFSDALGHKTTTSLNRIGRKFSLKKTLTENYDDEPLLNYNKLMKMKIGEFAMRRVMKREDLDENKITPDPIHVHGKNAFKYAFKFLNDFYKKDKIYTDFFEKEKSDEDMSDICYDVNAWLNENIYVSKEELNLDNIAENNNYVRNSKTYNELYKALTDIDYDFNGEKYDWEIMYRINELKRADKITQDQYDNVLNILKRM